MNFDWNWFFSSFCQSAAALIGIIGAFIISKIIGLNEKIETLIYKFNVCKIDYERIQNIIKNIDFEEFTKDVILYNSNMKDRIEDNFWQEEYSKEEALQMIYTDFPWLPKLDEVVLSAFDELHKYYWGESQNLRHRKNTKYEMMQNFVPEPDPYIIGGIHSANKNDEEYRHIKDLKVESNSLISRFKNSQNDFQKLEGSLIPPRKIIWLLMVAFPVLVLYPLHLMPVAANEEPHITFNILEIITMLTTLKSVLLFSFFVLIEWIFVYFLRLTKEYERIIKEQISAHTENYLLLDKYSKYLIEF